MRKLSEEQQAGFRINIGEYWRVLWRKKYFIVVPLAIAGIVSNIGVKFLVPIYESSTVVRIEDNTAANDAVARFIQGQGRRRSHDAEIAARLETDLLSSQFLDELIVHLGMDQDPALVNAAERTREMFYPEITAEELVFRRLRGFLRGRISIEREGAGLYRIIYSDANADACFVIAEAMTTFYIEVQRRQKIRGLQEVSDFSEEQIAVYKERLERSERDLERFQRDMAQRAMVSNPVNELNKGIAETLSRQIELSIRNAESTLEKIGERLATLLGSVPSDARIFNDPTLRDLEDNLVSTRETNLLMDLSGTAEIAGTATPAEAALSEVRSCQLRIQRHLADLVRSVYSKVDKDYWPLIAEYYFQQADLDSQRQRHRMLRSYINAFKQNVELGPQWDSELARLKADVEADRALYNQFRSSKTSTQISEAVQSTDLGATFTIVEKASRPLAPVRPNKMKILVLAVLFGVTIGAGGLLFTEFSDSSFRSVEEIERQLGLKVLGTVPRFKRETKWGKSSKLKRAIIWAAASIVVVTISLAGFYFYGKSSKEQMIDVNVTRNAQN